MADIVYQDNHILVAIKPQNVSLKNSSKESFFNQVKEEIKQKYGKGDNFYLKVLHSIDKAAGGLVLFSKTRKATTRIQESFNENAAEEKYLAVVVGNPRSKFEYLTDNLKINKKYMKTEIVPSSEEGAIRSKLAYTTLQKKDKLSLVELNIRNRIIHQIRVQLSNIKIPVFGDKIYGGDIVKGWNLALWSFKLRFEHPTTKKVMTFICSPPEDETPWKYFTLNKYLIVKN